MKKALLPVLLCCLLLSACGDRAAQSRYEAFADALSSAESLAFTAEVRCEYPERSQRFTLRYEKEAGVQRVTVLAPQLIEGVSATLGEDGAALCYEGVTLDTPPLDPYGLTPMNALPKLVSALATALPDTHWEEDGCAVYRLVPDDHLAVTVWFTEGMKPLAAELASDGNVGVFCELSDWSPSYERSAKENLGGDLPAQHPPQL